jgi:general secretion pathway protein J
MIAWRAPSLAGSRREDGFTLIEILVSLALLTFIAGLLAGALQFARGTWDAAAKLDRHAGHDMAEGFLRARLGEAMPLYERAVAGTVRVAFSGTADTLSFVAPAPNGPLGTGLYQYKLGLAAGAGRNVLMVGLSPYVAKQTERGAETGGVDYALATDVKSFGLRYYGRNQQRAQPAWHGTWTRTDILPDLVEIALVHGEGALNIVIELQLRSRRL